MAVVPRLASAVMLLRNGHAGSGMEVFMVRRVVQSEFMPDVYVFPGGSIKADDQAAEESPQLCAPVPARESVADPEDGPLWAREHGRRPFASYLRKRASCWLIAMARCWP